MREGGERQRCYSVQRRGASQHEVALPRPAAPGVSDYAFLHYNYKYDWLRLTLEEIVDSYTKLYGKESCESDIGSDESSAAEEVKEDGEED